MSTLGSASGGLGSANSGLTKTGPSGLTSSSASNVPLSSTQEWAQALEWNDEGYRLSQEGDREGGMALLSQSAAFGIPWALSTYTWWCLLDQEYERGLREFDACIGACESVVALLEDDEVFSATARLQLANARSNAALLMLASGGPLNQARDTWLAGAETGHAESMFYPAIVAEKNGDNRGADAVVRALTPAIWFDVRQTLREGIDEGGWFADWCMVGLRVLERNPLRVEPVEASAVNVEVVLQLPLASNATIEDGFWDAVQEATQGTEFGEEILREFAEGADAASWVARLELGTLLTNAELRSPEYAAEGLELLFLCLHAPFADIVATAAWNLATVYSSADQDEQAQEFIRLAVLLGDGTALRVTAEILLEDGHEDDARELLERAANELPLGDKNRALARAHLARLAGRALEQPLATWFAEHQDDLTVQEWSELGSLAMYAGDFNVDVAKAAIATNYFEECAAACYFEDVPRDCGDCGRNTKTFLHAASGRGDGVYGVFNLFGAMSSDQVGKIGVFIPFMEEDREDLLMAAGTNQFLDIIGSDAPLILGTLASTGHLNIFDAAKCRDDQDIAVQVEVDPGEYVVVCWLRPDMDVPAHVIGGNGDALACTALAALRGPLAEALLQAHEAAQPDVRDRIINLLWGDDNRRVNALMRDVRSEVLTRMIEVGEILETADSFLLQMAERDDDGADACIAIRESGRVGSQDTLDLLDMRGFVEPQLPWWQPSMADNRSDMWAPVVQARGDAPLEVWDVLLQSVWAKRATARRNDCSESMIRALIADDDVRVRTNLAANPSIPAETLQALAADEDASVLSAVAQNSQTPRSLLVQLAERANPPAGALAANPNTPAEVLPRLIEGATRSTRDALAARADLPPEIAERLSNDVRSIRATLASNERCPQWVLAVLAGDDDAWVRTAVARNSSAPESALHALSLDQDQDVRDAVMTNPASSDVARAQSSLLGATPPVSEDPSPARPSSASPAQRPVAAAQFCTNCGTPLVPTHRFCGGCGTQIAVAPQQTPSPDAWYALQAQWEIRGNFNVEGGSASYANQIFDWCDCENDTVEACDCGRAAGAYVAVTSGAGDGVYPVFRLSDERGEPSGAIAMFEQSWATETEAKTKQPADLVAVAQPVYAGSILVTDVAYVSDATAGWNQDYAIVDIELPPGEYQVIAWQADMEVLREAGMTPTRRQIALGLYRPELVAALEVIAPPDRSFESQIAMTSPHRMMDQVLAHHMPRWADACMYNAQEASDRLEDEIAESWLLHAAIHGHQPAIDLLKPGYLESTAPLDVARRTRLLAMRGQRVE